MLMFEVWGADLARGLLMLRSGCGLVRGEVSCVRADMLRRDLWGDWLAAMVVLVRACSPASQCMQIGDKQKRMLSLGLGCGATRRG